jgi:hypothetical protein
VAAHIQAEGEMRAILPAIIVSLGLIASALCVHADIQEADVEYYNPSTGYSASYTLDVEVEDGVVERIDFPNGGYIYVYADIEDGVATAEHNGCEYVIHVESDD